MFLSIVLAVVALLVPIWLYGFARFLDKITLPRSGEAKMQHGMIGLFVACLTGIIIGALFQNPNASDIVIAFGFLCGVVECVAAIWFLFYSPVRSY